MNKNKAVYRPVSPKYQKPSGQVSPIQSQYMRRTSPTTTSHSHRNPQDMRMTLSNDELLELKKDKYIQKLSEEICELTQRLSEQRLTILQQQIHLKEKDDRLGENFVIGERDGEISDLKRIIKMKESEYQQLLSKNIEARQEIKLLKGKLSEWEKEQSQLQASQTKLAKQSAQVQAETAKIHHIKQENDRLRNQYDSLVNTIRSVDISDSKVTQSPNKTSIPQYRAMFQSQKGCVKQKDVDQLSQRLMQSDQNLENVQKALQRKESEYNSLSKAHQDKINNLEKYNTMLRKRVDELTEIVESKDLQSVINDLQKKLTSSKHQCDQAKKQYEESGKTFEAETQNLRQNNAEMKKQIGHQEQIIQEMKKIQLDLTSKVQELEKKLPKEQESKDDPTSKRISIEVEKDLFLLTQKLSPKELQSRLKNAMQINKELEEQLTEFTKGDHSKDMQIYQLKESNKQHLDDAVSLSQQIEHLKIELLEYQSKGKPFPSNLDAQRQSDFGLISKQLEHVQVEMQQEIDRINDEKSKLQEEYSSQMHKVNQIKKMNFQGQQEFHQLQNEFQQCKEEKESLQMSLQLVQAKSGSGQTEELQQQYEKQIHQLQEEKLQSEKLAQRQIQILNKKIADIQDTNSKKTLELQKTRGSRRTSQLQTDHMSIQLQQKELKIQQLQKNLIETKQSYEALVEKAKQMSEKNKLLKEKMSKAHKLTKKDEGGEDTEQAPTSQFIWDLIITNEQETLTSLVQTGWEFAKSSAVPMKPFLRNICVFSFEKELLGRVLNGFFKQYLTDQISENDLIQSQAFVKVIEDTCVITKLMGHHIVAGMTMHKGSAKGVYDQLDQQLWEEVWLDYAQSQSDCLVVLIKDLNYDEEEVINGLIRLNPKNLLVIVQSSPRTNMIMEYLSNKFGLSAHDQTFTNNRVTLLKMEDTDVINQQLIRSKNEEERLFLDTFKVFMQRNAPKLFENQSKPSIKIQKLMASNTFNYTVQLPSWQLNSLRIPIVFNSMAPIVKMEVKDETCRFEIIMKGKNIIAVSAGALIISKHPKITCSQVALNLSFLDTKYPQFEQNILYVTQIPFMIESQLITQCVNGTCQIETRIGKTN